MLMCSLWLYSLCSIQSLLIKLKKFKMAPSTCYFCAQPGGVVCAGNCGKAYCPMCLVETLSQADDPVFNKERLDVGESLLSTLNNTTPFICGACKKGVSICSVCFGFQDDPQGSFLVCSAPDCAIAFHRQCYLKVGFPDKNISESSFICPKHVCIHCKNGESDLPAGICIRCSSMIHSSCRKLVARNMRPLFFGSRNENCACLCNKCYFLTLSISTRPPKQDEAALYLNMYATRRKDVSPQTLAALFDTPFVNHLYHNYKQLLADDCSNVKVETTERSNNIELKSLIPKPKHEILDEPHLKQLAFDSTITTTTTTTIQEKQAPSPVLQSPPQHHPVIEPEEPPLSTSAPAPVPAPAPASAPITITTVNARVLFTKEVQPEIVCCQIHIIKRKP